MEVAEQNSFTKYVQHWRDEVERLLWFELRTFIADQTLKGNFDRRTAVEEVAQEYQNQFPRWLDSARTTLAIGYFHNEKRKSDFKLPDAEASAAAFWLMVYEVVDSALEKRT